ncbi:kinase-like domain-containing protein [Cubamyces menziesii]|nr:kinase-like domain-containing protein [Cubamyces menziesii]
MADMSLSSENAGGQETSDKASHTSPQAPFVSSGTPYGPGGESDASIQTLHSRASMHGMKSIEEVVASMSQPGSGSATCTTWRDGSLVPDPSFEVDQVGDIRAVDSGWLDDDVEEVMVVKKKRKPLSVIIEASEGYHVHASPSKPKDRSTIDASDFEYIRTLCVDEHGERLVARKAESGQVYTVKLIRKSGYSADALAGRMRREQKILRVLRECQVPFVVQLFWSFEDERAMYLVMDRTDGRTLRSAIETQGPLFAHEAVLCAAELVEGISSLHAHGIVHANLKPESVLVAEDGHVSISDFDEAGFLGGSVRSQEYQAPELMMGWEYDYAVDWWSFGLLMFWVMTGTHPFVDDGDSGNISIVRSKILHAPLPEDQLGMSQTALQLASRCLQRNPALRIDGVGVKMHGYFSSIDWANVGTKRIEAPFAQQQHEAVDDLYVHDIVATDGVLPDASPSQGKEASFVYDYQRAPTTDSPSHPPEQTGPACSTGSIGSPGISGIRSHLQALRVEHDPSDAAVGLLNVPKSPTVIDIPRSASTSPERLDAVSGEFGALPDGVSGATARIGDLRRYSSLNFDLESSASVMSMNRGAESSARELVASPVRLRHARSFLGLSVGNTEDSLSLGSPSWTSRLRLRGRPETPPLTAPVPQLELPKGVQQIGNGIGYTRRADVRRSVLTLASLTPRTCQGIFTGRLPRLSGKRKPPKELVGTKHEDVAQEVDPMDEVMREIYGNDWVAAGSSPVDHPVSGGKREGLGWDEMVTRAHSMPAVDASFAGADSTLRLVSTPQLGLYQDV